MYLSIFYDIIFVGDKMKLSIKINSDLQNINLYKILNTNLNLSKRLITKLKNNKLIFCNNEVAYTNYIVKLNDIISVDIDFEEDNNDNIVALDKNIDIIYEDDCLIALNKPSNMPTHPSCNHFEDTLSNALKLYYLKNNINKTIRPINRLDKDTSGIVIFAKNQYIQEHLINQMKTLKFEKEYLAIVEGKLENIEGTINLPIARENNSIIKRCVNISGDNAITKYKVIDEFQINENIYSKLLIKLETGRTHQIRVHMSHIGHPIIGDSLYGKKSDIINRQALHCYHLSFIHPITNKKIMLEAKIPEDIQRLQL